MGPKIPKRNFRCEINKVLTGIERIQNIFPMRCLSFTFIMWALEIYFGAYEQIGLWNYKYYILVKWCKVRTWNK